MNKRIRYILFAMVVCSYFLISEVSVKAEQTIAIKNAFNLNNMVLLGTALKKFLAFRVVTVDLYIERGYGSDDVLSDVTKRLEVNYHVNIPKHELDRATVKGIEKNYSQDQMAALMPQIDQINSYYPDIKSGDQIAVTYVPGVGSQVELNGELRGVVPGSDFAKAFFSIWLGDNPVDKNAKLKLLGLSDR
ncbi:MAG: chalcone isomerase family protein [Candidatus Omnitrophica bacterium]|nr:chalcone isomerase family protein [Candidatus Omnitrophota bacterium]